MVLVSLARGNEAGVDPFEDPEGSFVVFNAVDGAVGHREWIATRAKAVALERIELVKDRPTLRWAISCCPLRTGPT